MAFNAFERMIAFRYLRPGRKDRFVSLISLLSLAGVTLGVGTLIVVMSVMNGFRHDIIERVIGVNGHAKILARGDAIGNLDAIMPAIRNLPHVVRSNPMIDGQALVIHKGAARGVLVRGISAEDLRARPLFANGMREGKLDQISKDGILIGEAMAHRLRLVLGDKLTLVAPSSHAGPFGSLPRMRSYKVVGIFNLGFYTYDNSAIFMSLRSARHFFNVKGEAKAIEIFLEHPDQAFPFREDARRVLGDGFRITHWYDTNSALVTALEVERTVMFVILSLIIVVAAFNIVSSLIMLVKDKRIDIAILRTMGATRGMVVQIFFLTGATIGIVGVATGTLLGLAFARNIETIRAWLENFTGTRLFDETLYFLSRLPSRVETMDVVIVAGMTLVLSFLATLYPAWRAARVDPVETLRYE